MRLFIAPLLLVMMTQPALWSASPRLRILVIGNSWSDQHQWPLMTGIMASKLRPPHAVSLRSVVARTASLSQIVATANCRQQLAEGNWDAILVQVHPLAIAFERDDCLQAIRSISTQAKAKRILLWHPPGPSVEAWRRERVDQDLDAIAAELRIERWDLEAAWQAASKLETPIETPTGLPNEHGAYLLAAALFAELTGHPTTGAVTSFSHASLPKLRIPTATAKALHQAAALAQTRTALPADPESTHSPSR